jgi:hypothetical protein
MCLVNQVSSHVPPIVCRGKLSRRRSKRGNFLNALERFPYLLEPARRSISEATSFSRRAGKLFSDTCESVPLRSLWEASRKPLQGRSGRASISLQKATSSDYERCASGERQGNAGGFDGAPALSTGQGGRRNGPRGCWAAIPRSPGTRAAQSCRPGRKKRS